LRVSGHQEAKNVTVLAELKKLTKCFGNRAVLDDITLQIEQGEILGLLGPNGSGKTTLLKILAFLEKPERGEVKFRGETVTDKNAEPMRLHSTIVFQRTILFSTSVFNNIAYGLRMRRLPQNTIKEEVKKALRLVELEGFEKRPAKKLSGGEQQRVALSRALVLKTELLLLDEPTANLDPKNTQIMEEAIARINRELKTTIVVATHNMFQAKTLPHRIALINDGKITEIGETAEIFGRLSKNLARFAAVENTFTGTAKVTAVGTTIVDIGGDVQIEAAVQRQGVTSVFVNPQDIILSKSPVASSARNVFKGRIIEIFDLGTLVKLKIDIGKPFTVQITKRSFNEMALNLNAEVFIAFKASSVQMV
jgi:tungstate transport system ATP-binding protein